MHTSIDNYKLRRSSFIFPVILFFLVFFIAAEARALTTGTILLVMIYRTNLAY